MCVRRVRGLVTSLGAVAVLLGVPVQSYALFDWLCPPRICYPQTVVTTYSPPFSGEPMGWAPRYNAPPWGQPVPVAAPVVVPVVMPAATTCCYTSAPYASPVAYPMVTYRPVTTWTYRPQHVPYGVSRVVFYSSPIAGDTAVQRPAYGVAFPATVSRPGCASCVQSMPVPNVASPIPSSVPSSSSTVFPAPSLPGPLPVTSQPVTVAPGSAAPGQGGTSRYWPLPQNGSSSTSGGSSTGIPTQRLPAPGSSTSPSTSSGPSAPEVTPGPIKTFEQGTQPSPQERLKPTPDSNTGSEPAKMPTLGSPQGRTAQRSVFRSAVYVQPVSSKSQAGSPDRPRLDTSGWEAAGD